MHIQELHSNVWPKNECAFNNQLLLIRHGAVQVNLNDVYLENLR